MAIVTSFNPRIRTGAEIPSGGTDEGVRGAVPLSSLIPLGDGLRLNPRQVDFGVTAHIFSVRSA